MKYRNLLILGVAFISLNLPVMASKAEPVANKAERPMVMVDKNARYRAVYNIHSGEEMAGVSRGLFYARGLIEAFRKQGVKPKQLDIHLVLHGDAAKFLLVDDTYQEVTNDPFNVNLNSNLVQDLIDLGVSMEICHSTMKNKKWKAADILPGVIIVHDGYTRLIKLQNAGYALIGDF